MPEYLVKWKINVNADSPREAAEQAWAHMRRPDSTANVFLVISEEVPGSFYHIDLMDGGEP